MNASRSYNTERTRQKILDAALHLFAAHGYTGASTQAIIEASQVTKPVLYYHFGSKAGLFRAVVDRAENQLLEMISRIKGDVENTPERLVEICAAMFKFACDRPEVMSLAVDLLLQAKEQGPPHNHCFGKAQKRLAVIQDVMEQGQIENALRNRFNSRLLAVGFLGMIHLHILFRLADPRSLLTRSTAKQAVSLFLEGAATGKLQPVPINTQQMKELTK
jgi:AcrR family transcriptional regulator